MGFLFASRKSRDPKSGEHESMAGETSDHNSERHAARLVCADDVRTAIENVRQAQMHTSEKFALTVLEEMHDSNTLAPIVSEKVQEWPSDVRQKVPSAYMASMKSIQSSDSKTALLMQMPSMTSIQSDILRDEATQGQTLMPSSPLNHMSSSASLESQNSRTSTKCGKSGIELASSNGSTIWEKPPPRISVKFADVSWTARQKAISDGTEDEIGPVHRLDVQIEFDRGRKGHQRRRGCWLSRSLRRLSCGYWP